MNANVAEENENTTTVPLWNDTTAPVAARVDALVAEMTLAE